jgi:hypothetical protein
MFLISISELIQGESSVLDFSFSKPIVQEIFEFLIKLFKMYFFKVNTKLIEVVLPKIIWHILIKILNLNQQTCQTIWETK